MTYPAVLRLCRLAAAVVLATAPLANGFVAPGLAGLPSKAQTTSQAASTTMMAARRGSKEQWVPIISLDTAPGPCTATSVDVAGLDLCVAADEKGLLYVFGNKCPPANQPLSFSVVNGKTIKDPVFGTKINIETGDVEEWCPSLLGRLLSPILGPKPEDAGVNVFNVRSKGGNLEVFINVNAKSEYEESYWKGILDAQGKADGGYY